MSTSPTTRSATRSNATALWASALACAALTLTACADDAAPEPKGQGEVDRGTNPGDGDGDGDGDTDGGGNGDMASDAGATEAPPPAPPAAPGCDGGACRDAGPPMCGTDGDCAEGHVCEDGLCQLLPACETDEDCADESFCNGVERCLTTGDGERYCAPGNPPCLRAVCDDNTRRCDCDHDRDGEQSVFCGGADNDDDNDGSPALDASGDPFDCDDGDAFRHPDAPEVCDAAGVDEDCNYGTVAGDDLTSDARADVDQDGFVGRDCYNIDPITRVFHYVSQDKLDCDDTRKLVNPDALEACSGLELDEDCDGKVDEDDGQEFALRSEFCVDNDGDGYSEQVVGEGVAACGAPQGYTLCGPASARDCDDRPGVGVRSQPGLVEVCDGLDNDCDGTTDEDTPEDPLADKLSFPETTLACGEDDGRWYITECPTGRAWCGAPNFVSQGCETDTTTRANCGGCALTNCNFACTDGACETIQEVSINADFACATTSAGRASCWGRGRDGRLGDDRARDSSVPTLVLGVEGVVQVGTGWAHACARTAGGEVYCWGDNTHWQISELQGESVPVATRVFGGVLPNLSDAEELTVGDDHACVKRSDGTAACWGDNRYGQLGDYTSQLDRSPLNLVRRETVVFLPPPIPPQTLPAIVTDVKSIQAGRRHTCLLREDPTAGVECWGDNQSGAVTGVPGTGAVRKPQAVAGIPSGVTQLTVGGRHNCVLAAGVPYCWGDNSHGQIGPRGQGEDNGVKAVGGMPDLIALAGGRDRTCGLTAGGALYCWGAPLPGEDSQASAPRQVPTPAPATEVDVYTNLCVLTESSTGYCMGTSPFGENGNGIRSTERRPFSDPIAPLEGAR